MVVSSGAVIKVVGGKEDVVVARAKRHRWYLGGLASAGAAFFTHPLDLLKVHLQTQQEVKRRLLGMAVTVVRENGVIALYNGLTASLCRQLSYSTTRFGVYEILKGKLVDSADGNLPFYQKILVGSAGGFCGVLVGSPFDVVNIRMQNDMKLPSSQRRNYRHVLDGLRRVAMDEGLFSLWRGASLNIVRGILMTLGQIAFYEQVKQTLLSTGRFKDNIITHFSSSLVAGVIATALTQPVDVLKTRMMSSKPGEFRSVLHCLYYTSRTGVFGFYKGFVPALVRLGPHTIITFIILEQLRRVFPPN